MLQLIEQEADRRRTIAAQIKHSLAEELRSIRTDQLTLEAALLWGDPRSDPRWRDLEAQRERLQRALHQETAQHWRDEAQLTREFRTWLYEYRQEERRTTLLDARQER